MIYSERFKVFEKLYQVICWFMTAALLVVVFGTHYAAPSDKAFLVLISSLFGISSLLFVNLLPISSERGLKYGPEDKVLVESLVMILLMTAFLYLHPLGSAGFFLYLIPILIESAALHERIILGEACFSAVGIVFLRLSGGGYLSVFETGFLIELGVFMSIIALMYFLTRQLRLSGEKNDELSEHLSERLDQIQVISMLVQQSENFTRFDQLLSRIGEITSDAFDAEQCGFFLQEGSGELVLHEASTGFDAHDRAVYEVESNMKVPLEVFENGKPIMNNPSSDDAEVGTSLLIGDRHLKNYLMAPLQKASGNLGVVMIANRRGAPFTQKDLYFLQLLAGFISTLIDSAFTFSKIEEERASAKKMTKLLVGREIMMRDLKRRLGEKSL